MALPPLATVDDLATWMGVDVAELNMERAEAILKAASTLIRAETGRVWVDADGEPEEGIPEVKLEAAREVTVMVAERVYSNPRGVTQRTAGPFSESVAAWAAYGLKLTDDEKAMVGSSTGGIPGLASLRVEAPAHAAGVPRTHYWWRDDE